MGGEGETISGHLMAPGYGGWMAYGLDDIWEMLQHEDGRVNWSQYYGWRRMAQLCEEEADQLEKAVRRLVQLWPDRPGSAAEAFNAFVGGLVASMRETAAAAAVNADALYGVTAKLLAARAEIAALLQQRLIYAQAEQQMIEYTQAMTRLPGAPIQPPPPEPERPPDNWWDALDRQARNIMAESDAAIATDAARFTAPRQYMPQLDAEGQRQQAPSVASTGPLSLSGLNPVSPSPVNPPQFSVRPGDPLPVLDGGIDQTPALGTRPIDTHSGQGPTYRGVPEPSLGVPIRPSRPFDGAARSSPNVSTPSGPLAVGGTATSAPRSALGTPGGIAPVPPMAAGRPVTSDGTSVAPGGRAASPYGRRRPNEVRDQANGARHVPPVLDAPSVIDSHDPGPGVIGIDR